MADAPTYTNWKDLQTPVGCSRCGALVPSDVTDKHTAYHAAQDEVERKVNDQGLELIRVRGLLGIRLF